MFSSGKRLILMDLAICGTDMDQDEQHTIIFHQIMWYYSLFASENVHNEGLKAYKRILLYIYIYYLQTLAAHAHQPSSRCCHCHRRRARCLLQFLSSFHFILYNLLLLRWAQLSFSSSIHCFVSSFWLEFSSQSDLFKFARSSYSSWDCYCLTRNQSDSALPFVCYE